VAKTHRNWDFFARVVENAVDQEDLVGVGKNPETKKRKKRKK
jgi:hypothetical protein